MDLPITSSDDEQIDQLESDVDEAPIELPTTPKACQTSCPPASLILSSAFDHHSAGQTSAESGLLCVQSSSDEQMVLKAAFDKLSSIVESTAKETSFSAESIALQWVSQRILTPNPTKKAKGAELSVCNAADEYYHDYEDAIVSQTLVRKKASRTNSIEKELREIICKRADEIKLPVMGSNGLQWSTLLEIMAENGCYFDNYPTITLPGDTSSAGRKKGVREVPVEEQRILLDAMSAKDHRCIFKAYKSQSPADVKALQESEAPIIVFKPPTGTSKLERGKRYFLDGTFDFEGHQKCSQHHGCKDNGGVTVTQGRQSRFTIANSRMLHSRCKPSSAGSRKVSPAQVGEDTDAQRSREEADNGQEKEGTTVSVKRRRVDSPDDLSIRGSPMPMREHAVSIPSSMPSERSYPDEQMFHESHGFLQEGPSRYVNDPSHYSEIVQNIWKKDSLEK